MSLLTFRFKVKYIKALCVLKDDIIAKEIVHKSFHQAISTTENKTDDTLVRVDERRTFPTF